MDALEGLAKLCVERVKKRCPCSGYRRPCGSTPSERTETVTLIPLGLFGGLSALAASVIMVLALQFWNYMTSPVMGTGGASAGDTVMVGETVSQVSVAFHRPPLSRRQLLTQLWWRA